MSLTEAPEAEIPVARLLVELSEAGRQSTDPLADATPTPDGHDRLLFTGTPERIAEDLRAYKAMGVQETIFDFRAPPLTQTVENMEHFMKEVAPLVE